MSLVVEMIIDKSGYRMNVGIILASPRKHLFWGRRIGHDTWQFPQGGMNENESPEETMYRELYEEVGLQPQDVTLLAETKDWLSYQLPEQYIRRNSIPLVVGQKQKWYLLALNCSEQKIRLDLTSSPEFDSWRWVEYWYPTREVIYFKRDVYHQALSEFEKLLFEEG